MDDEGNWNSLSVDMTALCMVFAKKFCHSRVYILLQCSRKEGCSCVPPLTARLCRLDLTATTLSDNLHFVGRNHMQLSFLLLHLLSLFPLPTSPFLSFPMFILLSYSYLPPLPLSSTSPPSFSTSPPSFSTGNNEQQLSCDPTPSSHLQLPCPHQLLLPQKPTHDRG